MAQSRGKKIGRRLLVGVVLLALFIFFLPWIIA